MNMDHIQSTPTLRFLLVGDADVGKREILDSLRSRTPSSADPMRPRQTSILHEGRPVNLHLWDASGQGRFSTVYRTHARGAHGIIIVYDITNRWSFNGLKQWIREVDNTAPGIPRILIGNNLHLEFDRAIPKKDAEHFAAKKNLQYFEVSTMAGFNIQESLVEMTRLAFERNGFSKTLRRRRVPTLQSLCSRVIGCHMVNIHYIDRLPIPADLQYQVRSYAHGAATCSPRLPEKKSKRKTLSKRIKSVKRAAGNFLLAILRSSVNPLNQ